MFSSASLVVSPQGDSRYGESRVLFLISNQILVRAEAVAPALNWLVIYLRVQFSGYGQTDSEQRGLSSDRSRRSAYGIHVVTARRLIDENSPSRTQLQLRKAQS